MRRGKPRRAMKPSPTNTELSPTSPDLSAPKGGEEKTASLK